MGTNNISVLNGSVNLSSSISIDNYSLTNLSADEIASGLGGITANGTDLACFGNNNLPTYPAISQSTGGVVTINSYANYKYFKKKQEQTERHNRNILLVML